MAAGGAAVRLLEGPGDRLERGGIHADPGVGDLQVQPRVAVRPQGQPHLALGGELGRVGQQVVQDLLELHEVRSHVLGAGRQVHGQGVVVPIHQRVDGRLDLFDQLGKIHVFPEDLHAPGLDLREIEHVVDQPQQVGAGAVDPRHVFAHVRGGLLHQQLRVAEDGVERRAQFVAHVRQEGGLCFVGLPR